MRNNYCRHSLCSHLLVPLFLDYMVADKFSGKYQNSLRLEPATEMHHHLLLMQTMTSSLFKGGKQGREMLIYV